MPPGTVMNILLRDRGSTIFLGALGLIILFVPIGNLLIPETSSFHVPTYLVSLLGKYICFALLAISVDLIWGFCGILSLGHGAFFALGGYAMGMHLMRQIGDRGIRKRRIARLYGVSRVGLSAMVLVWL